MLYAFRFGVLGYIKGVRQVSGIKIGASELVGQDGIR